MVIFFEVIKAVFFGLTIIVGVFYLRGEYLGLQETQVQEIQSFLMPGYMLFCGIMLGYLIAHVRSGTLQTEDEKKNVYIKSFIIGIGLGLGLAIVYMVV